MEIARRPTGALGDLLLIFSDAINNVNQETAHKIEAARLNIKRTMKIVTVRAHVAVHLS
jgi:hypothetical protein